MNKASPGESAFALHCLANEIAPESEFRFCERRWRFDFAWPEIKLAVEIEGGTWIAGRHNRGSSFEKDLEKYNTAARLGWTVLRYTTQMVLSGQAINEVMEILKGEKAA